MCRDVCAFRAHHERRDDDMKRRQHTTIERDCAQCVIMQMYERARIVDATRDVDDARAYVETCTRAYDDARDARTRRDNATTQRTCVRARFALYNATYTYTCALRAYTLLNATRDASIATQS
jgi:hypothetical protein